MTPPVLVAVVSWNTRDLLDACLTALRADADAGRAAVWVVDNGSADGSATMVAERHPWARLVVSTENLGFGRAVNLVAREAPAGWSWIAPANADVAPQHGALEALLAAGAADPRAGILAPRLVLPDGAPQHSVLPFPTLATAAALNLGLPRVVPGLGDRLCLEGDWDARRARRVPWAIGAFWLVRREAWLASAGFDERQFMYAEDLDLGWRAARAGWHTRYVPAAAVRHESAAATTQAWGEARLERMQVETYAWIRRRRGRAAWLAYGAANVAGAGARWLALAALARRRPERHAWQRDRWRRWTARHAAALRATAGRADR